MEQTRKLRAQGESPLDGVVLPEDVVHQLQLIPDRSKVTSVILSQQRRIEDQLADRLDGKLKALLTEGFSDAQATMDPHGNLSIFRGKTGDLDVVFKHEQVHVNHDDALYPAARHLDSVVEASRYGYKNGHESEAELESMAFLSGSVPTFMEATVRAPHRMAVIAKKQIATLEAAKPENRSLDQLEILARARYVQDHVTPRLLDSLSERVMHGRLPNESILVLGGLATAPHAKAQAAMLHAIENGDALQRRSAAKVLLTVGDPSAVSALQTIAARSPKVAHTALDAATSLASSGEHERQEFLASLTKRPELADAALKVFEDKGYLESPSALKLLAGTPPGVVTDPIGQIRFNLGNGRREAAAHLVRNYGDASDIERLRPLAADSDNKALSTRALDSMILLHSKDPREQFDFLLDQIAPNSPVRETALRTLAESGAKDSPQYPWKEDNRWSVYQVLSDHLLNPSKGNHGGAAEAIKQLPDAAAKKYWFDESLTAIDRMGGWKERIAHDQGILVRQVFRQVPELRLEATQRLKQLRIKPSSDDVLEADIAQAVLQVARSAAPVAAE